MQITKTTPNFTARTITINPNENKNVKYLYNKVVDIISEPETRLPATFSEKNIKLESPSDYQQVANRVVSALNNAGIKFSDSAKLDKIV